MKLIECYIENFGRLHAYTHKFSDGLNVITGKNGCGKTTLSVFIKSMLYGIETKKSRGEDTDRKRYFPWQGGRFGGSLTFENGGKNYRIERTFGDKPAGDAFALYNADTGALSTDFGECLGEEIFGIDADGFERTVFLSERKFSVSQNNPTVSAKLSNLAGVDGDMGNYEIAMDELEKKEKFYRHRRGKGGLIGDIKSNISALDGELLDLSRKKEGVKAMEDGLSELSKRVEAYESEKKKIEKTRLCDEYKKELLRKKSALRSCEEMLEKEKNFFGGIVPSAEEIRYYEQKKNRSLVFLDTVKKDRAILGEFPADSSEVTEEYINLAVTIKTKQNVNKSCYIYSFSAIILAVLALALGLFVSPICYLISALALPLIYLTFRSLKAAKPDGNADEIFEKIRGYVLSKTGKLAGEKEELLALLGEIKTDALAKKMEKERLIEAIEKNEELLDSLTKEYEAFLSRFTLTTDDGFGELRAHLSSYEALLREITTRAHEADVYASEHGLNAERDVSGAEFSEQALANIEAQLRAIRAERFSEESRLSALYDELSREDELKERRLELTDKLSESERAHKNVIKTAEHLALAKERLTAKYLGKMRTAFDSYVERIGAEDSKAFTLDTDFSLTKTENGLTNPITSYSLGTKEAYALITRLALVDALYEKNPPFIILDDPFCHFDDAKCTAAMNAVKRIAADKQIIYLTCAESRTPD